MEPEKAWTVALGVVVRELRRELGLSQEKLAQRIDLTKNHVHSIEHGETRVSFETFVKLGQELGVRPKGLLAKVEALVLSPELLSAAKDLLQADRKVGRQRLGPR